MTSAIQRQAVNQLKKSFSCQKNQKQKYEYSLCILSVFLCKFHLKCAGSNSGFMNVVSPLFLEYIKTVMYLIPGKILPI